MDLRKFLTLSTVLLTLLGSAAVSFAADWCIRPGASGAPCQVLRTEQDQTFVFNLPQNYQVKISNELESNRVQVFQNNTLVDTMLAGSPEVPLNVTPSPIKKSLRVGNVVVIKPDGVVEIGSGTQRSFFIPYNGGIVLVPVNNNFTVAWSRGSNELRAFDALSPVVRERTRFLVTYLGFSTNAVITPSNYYLDIEEEVDVDTAGTPACCCGGTGKKTLIRYMGGRGNEKIGGYDQMNNIMDGLSEQEKECVEVRINPYDPDQCPEAIAKDLAKTNARDMESGRWCKVVNVGHSQAGIAVAYAAGLTPGVESHSLGSPLQGQYFDPTFVLGASIPMGSLWTATTPISETLGRAVTNCMSRAAISSHNYPPISPTSGSSFTAHSGKPSNTYPLHTQEGGPAGSKPPKNHPGVDHGGMAKEGLSDVVNDQSCTNCGNNVAEEPTEECDPPGSECQAALLGDKGVCDQKCKCEPLCGNGVLDPGEECEAGQTAVCYCQYGMWHDVQCNLDCTIPSCNHPAPDPVPVPSVVSKCGDNVVSGNEQCDPPGSQCTGMTPSGSGTCNSACECVDNCTGEACNDATNTSHY